VRYSPLRFEADGRLLVQTPHGLMRVANDGSGSEALDPNASEPKSWPLQVENAQGAQWIGLTYACDRSETLLNLAGASSSTLASELLAPRPGTCRGGSLPRSTPPIPLSFQGTTPEAIVAGKSINAQAERVPAAVVPGSARSPDGQYLAVPSPLGLVIASRERTALWYSADVNWSALEASDCVVANAARAAACISGGRARLFIPKSR
jgi:hypothetical protein